MDELKPLRIDGNCIASDEELFHNIEAAIARGLPEIGEIGDPIEQPLVVVASGPSVAGQLEQIRGFQKVGMPILAIKDAHDWLIERGIIPDYGFAIDPQPHRFNCFTRKHPDVHYVIASQCNVTMFEHLKEHRVSIWHPYFQDGQQRPANKLLIAGGSTSGLRALNVFYVLGYRRFLLFGYDSCMSGDVLRVDGSGKKPHDSIVEIRLDPDGEVFRCNMSMALQAQQFEDQFYLLPGAEFVIYGGGLISAIVDRRHRNTMEIAAARAETPMEPNDRISFIHKMDANSASYRYRAQIPARELGAELNDFTASTLVFSKIEPQELMEMALAKARGQWVVADFCDDHFQWMHYQEALRIANAITCSTEVLKNKIAELGREAVIIHDPFEFQLMPPHCRGTKLLWFGHHVNRGGLQRILPELDKEDLHVVGNFGGAIPWSHETMIAEFARADIVIIPATEPYKSANRTVEAVRQGCFVVAEPHPALMDIPGIWIGNIKEGIEWARQHKGQARRRTSLAAQYVTEKYSPRTVASAWKTAIQRPITSEVAESIGMAG